MRLSTSQVLGDFDTLRSASVSMTATLGGTLMYMAPEVKAGRSHTPAADVFSLGMVAKEMFAEVLEPGSEEVTLLIVYIVCHRPGGVSVGSLTCIYFRPRVCGCWILGPKRPCSDLYIP